MVRRENRCPLLVLTLLIAFSPATADPQPIKQSAESVRPLLKAEAAGPVISTEAASKQVITALVDYLLKNGNDDHIGKNLAVVIGLPRPAPIKTQIIEEQEDLKAGTRTVLEAALVYEVPPGYPKVHGNRPLSIYILTVNTAGRDTHSLFFRVNLNGLPERAVASDAKDDELALPVRGSGVTFERDLSSKETRKSYDAAMERIRNWLAKPAIPPVDDSLEKLAVEELAAVYIRTAKPGELTTEQAIADAKAAVKADKQNLQITDSLQFELTQSDTARLRDIHGEILALGKQLKKKQLSQAQYAQAVGRLKAQAIEIVSRNQASPVYSAAAAIMIESGDLAAASNYVDKAIDKWGVAIPIESTDWQVEDIRWSRRDGADGYAMQAALLNAKGDIIGAARAADVALRLYPQCARAAEECAAAIKNAERKLRQAAELTPSDYENVYKMGQREMDKGLPAPPHDKAIERLMRPDNGPHPTATKVGPGQIYPLQVISSCFLILLVGGLLARRAGA